MSSSQSHVHIQSFPAIDLDIPRSAGAVKSEHSASNSPAGLQDLISRSATHHGHLGAEVSHSLTDASPHFGEFSFPYQDMSDGNHMIAFEDHAVDLFATPGRGSISLSSAPDRTESVGSAPTHVTTFNMGNPPQRRASFDGSEDGSQDSNHGGGHSLDEAISDEFGLAAGGPGDGSDNARQKAEKGDHAPAWSELKTKAGKERKRLPLACIACRRKKIRCSGEKPACKHCLRSRIPCVYKVTTRKAAPRTDYMAMLDKRLKRMEDRIIKIVPKTEQDASAAAVTRAVVKPAIPGTLPAGKQNSKKRSADEALGSDLDSWAKSSKTKADGPGKQSSLQLQEAEENKLLHEGREALPPKDIQEHLAEVFFENIYGQAYHLLHKPSYMRKLKAGTLPPVLILSVCAVSARFSTHPKFSLSHIPFLRGEEWASAARDIVTKQYEWPNITILTCLLILGLHEFGTCHGGRSWSLGGQAIRMAFALQLHKDLDHDPLRPNSKSQLSFIDREIRRRTMWACYVMDRFNSSGTDRPIFIKEETLKIQLPIQEKCFQLDMPGPTENLEGKIAYSASEDGQVTNAQENMGVAAYMIKAIAIWGKVIGYLNQGGKELDDHPMWSSESGYSELIRLTEEFPESLPESLKYTTDSLHLHDTEGMANQFLFLHIAIQQNILFMNRFAVTSPNALSHEDIPSSFVTKAGAKAFAAANKISDILKDAETHFITAPFVGYCAFLSSTVHIFGIFSGNDAIDSISKKNLAINVKFLSRMKRYWGMFHWMTENLREQYRSFADAQRGDSQAKESAGMSPIFQYGDWFDRYPHGVSQSDFLDPVITRKKEKGDDAVLEQKQELHTVEEFFTQLSPPQSAESRAEASASGKPAAGGAKRKPIAKRGGTGPSRSDSHHLEPLFTDLNPAQMQEQIQQRLQHQRNRSGHLGGQTSGPTSYNGHVSHAQNAAQYHALSPISPVTFGHHPNAAWYNNDLLSLSLGNNNSGMMPQLDRQLVLGAYGGLDPAIMSGQEIIDWNAALSAHSDHRHPHGHRHSHGHGHGTGHGHGHGSGHTASSAQQQADPVSTTAAMGQEPSSAWFMPFNMEPPEMGQDLGLGVGGMDNFSGVFSPTSNGMTTPGAMGLRRGGH